MRKIRLLSLMLALGLLITSVTGCSLVKAEKMEKVKGTYKLTNLKITDAETKEVTDCIVEKGYEEYFIVTGEEKGYYVHKDNQTEQAYYREVWLTYEYDEEDSSLVKSVAYRYSQYGNSYEYRFGVAYGGLNFSKPPYNPQADWLNALDGEEWDWKKESDAIDLSYATEKLGELVAYQAN